jgi:hypothetical protein
VVDLSDDGSDCVQSIPLLWGGEGYPGLDVVLDPAGSVYVLTREGFGNHVAILEVDVEAGEVVDLLTISGYVSADRLAWYGGFFYVVGDRLEAATGPGAVDDLVTTIDYAGNVSSTNRPALSPDGAHILLYTNGEATEYEVTTQGVITNSYQLLEGIGNRAQDLAYSPDGDRIVGMVLDYNLMFVQVWDRASSNTLYSAPVGPEHGTISYDIKFQVLSSDGEYAYFYVYDDFWTDEFGYVMRAKLSAD